MSDDLKSAEDAESASSAPPAQARFAFRTTFLVVIALILFTRLPYFFVDVIDWDESTFILMGRSILDGYLPYDFVWDNKPPLIFGLFAALEVLPGDPVVIVRAFGTLCVALTAVLVYFLTRRMSNDNAAEFAAVLYVLGMATTGSGQATTSELLSMLPVLAAVWLLSHERLTAGYYFSVGSLLSIATLVRLNLAFVVIAVGIWIIAVNYRRGWRLLASAVIWYSAGGIAILLACVLPYAVYGSLGLFWYSVFEAPFAYASLQRGPVDNLVQHAYNAMGLRLGVNTSQLIFGVVCWAASVVGLVLLLFRNYHPGAPRGVMLLVLLVALATGLSILMSGVAPLHYLIAFIPFVAMFGAVPYGGASTRFGRGLATGVIAVAALFVLRAPTMEYFAIGKRIAANEGLMYGPSFVVAEYLRPLCGRGCSVYLMEDHLAYVLIGAYPPRKIVTHPSNIAKPSLMSAKIGTAPTPVAEMMALLEARPEYIVKRERVWYLQQDQELILEEALARDYEIARVLGDRFVYRLKRRPNSEARAGRAPF